MELNFTSYQKEVFIYSNLGLIHYETMWEEKRTLGYSGRGTSENYDVVIAADIKEEEIRDIVLLHEIGHIFFNHLDVDSNEELNAIKKIFKKLNKPFEWISFYGGPFSFLNLAMDLEVNSKLLTFNNVQKINKYLSKYKSHIYTVDYFDFEVMDNFRDYYIPLIQRLKEDTKKINTFKDVPFDLNDIKDSEIKEKAKNEEGIIPKSKEPIRGKGYSKEQILKEDKEDLNIIEESSENIKNFILNVLKKTSPEWKEDHFKIYNRNIRPNKDSIFYISKKRKLSSNTRKMCFLIDVSNSMDPSSLIEVLSTLNDLITHIAPFSKIVTWNTNLEQEFNLNQKIQNLRIGGNTDMAAAVDYITSQGFTDCFIYSDLITHIGELEKSFKKSSINFYGLVIINPLNKILEYIKPLLKYFTKYQILLKKNP